MADTDKQQSAEEKAARRKAAVRAWHEAGADAGKLRAAVKDFPELVEIYSRAVEFVEVAA